MKQIQECLDRALGQQTPLKKKWQARLLLGGYKLLFLYHYHHLILIYNMDHQQPLYQWWEKPADYRGLRAALDYFENRKIRLTNSHDVHEI